MINAAFVSAANRIRFSRISRAESISGHRIKKAIENDEFLVAFITLISGTVDLSTKLKNVTLNEVLYHTFSG